MFQLNLVYSMILLLLHSVEEDLNLLQFISKFVKRSINGENLFVHIHIQIYILFHLNINYTHTYVQH